MPLLLSEGAMDCCQGYASFLLAIVATLGVSSRRRKQLLIEPSCSDATAYCGGYLSQTQIDEFLSRGVLVVPGALTRGEVRAARLGLHGHLSQHGVSAAQ
jgi:hypothetical protein